MCVRSVCMCVRVCMCACVPVVEHVPIHRPVPGVEVTPPAPPAERYRRRVASLHLRRPRQSGHLCNTDRKHVVTSPETRGHITGNTWSGSPRGRASRDG